jgi:hypothetical protein
MACEKLENLKVEKSTCIKCKKIRNSKIRAFLMGTLIKTKKNRPHENILVRMLPIDVFNMIIKQV